MIKKMSKFGNSHGIIIDKPILQLLGIDADTELEVETDGQSLVITPVKKAAQKSKALCTKSASKKAVSIKKSKNKKPETKKQTTKPKLEEYSEEDLERFRKTFAKNIDLYAPLLKRLAQE